MAVKLEGNVSPLRKQNGRYRALKEPLDATCEVFYRGEQADLMESGVRQKAKNLGSAAPWSIKVDFVEAVSHSMRGVEAVMREVAQSEVPVLLLAERGAGKKATARRVHELSRHGKQTFRVAACGALQPVELGDGAGSGIGLTGTGTIVLEEVAKLGQEIRVRLRVAL